MAHKPKPKPTPPTPVPTPVLAPSPSGTLVTTVGPTIVDSALNTWALLSNGQLSINGVVIGTSSNVTLLLFYNGVIYAENTNPEWYKATANGNSVGWTPISGDPRPATPPTPPTPPAPSTVPAQAAAVGYTTETFNSTFTPAKFDTALAYPAGDEWYCNNFFGAMPSNSGITFNPSGGATFSGTGQNGYNGQVSSAGMKGSTWHGTAFGGGAYFEATLSFNPLTVNLGDGAPAFWMMSIEHLAGLASEQWAGQAAGYEHFSEIDALEYSWFTGGDYASYTGNILDWYGPSGNLGYADLNGSAGRNTGTSNQNWNNPTKIGLLWVPATATTPGYAAWYLNDVLQPPNTYWTQFTGQAPPPGTAPWTYGIVDLQHLVLLLGNGPSSALTAYSVKVWQASNANKLAQ